MAAPAPLFRSADLSGGFRLHLHRTQAFKTLDARLAFHADLDDGTAARALLPRVLGRGTVRHPSLRAMQIALDTLFGATLSGSAGKLGERHVLLFHGNWITDRIAGRKVLPEMGRLFRELLREPAQDARGGARGEVLEQERKLQADEADAVFDDKGRYARHRLLEAMCKGEPYARPAIGRAAEIRAVTTDAVNQAHRALLDTAEADLFLVGDLSWAAAARFAKSFGFPAGRATAPHQPPVLRRPARVHTVIERQEVGQGKLELGFRTPIRLGHPLYPGLVLFNMLFGGSPTGKLFKTVREKASLCYSISSGIERSKGLVLVQAGIEVKQYARARRMILDLLDDLRAGKVAGEEEAQARAQLLSGLRVLRDRPGGIIDFALERAVNGLPADLDGLVRALEKVSVAQAAEAARSVELDTVYFLRNR
ncbi:MAG: EF-P 5-aminopentanol modification-associated protein YfmF [Planctomycetaceae bacterium]